jgi:Protein of unknown function (DUF3631)/Domain of unknown function (DUF3854)
LRPGKPCRLTALQNYGNEPGADLDRKGGPPAAWKTKQMQEQHSTLSPADLATFEKLRIPAELVARAGIFRVSDREARKPYGITGGGDMAGIAFPYWEPFSMMNGSAWRRWYLRVRRDNPEIVDGKPKKKYVAPYGGNSHRHFYFPPCPEWFKDVDVPIVLVEAEKSALALLAWALRVGRKILPVAIGGCYGWSGKIGIKTTATGERVPEHGALLDLGICRDGRQTFILYDGNAASKPDVAKARAGLVRELYKRKAKVRILDLPPSDDWNGPDDYIAVKGDEAMARIFDGADEGSNVLAEIESFVRQFVIVTPAQSTAISLWIAHTWCASVCIYTPYLAVTSATKQCGKSKLLEALEYLVHEPWLTSGASAASLFRKIEERFPTLLLDEVDAIFKGDKEMSEAVRGVLNSGAHHRGKVTRCVGQGTNITTKDFSTFCPKAFSGIGHLPDTVADRSLPIRLMRKLHTEETARLRERTVERVAKPLRERLAAWVKVQILTIKNAEPDLPDQLSDRQQDGGEILLQIADIAGGDWPAKGRAALLELYRGEDGADEAIHVRLLADIRTIFDEQVADKIFSEDLAAKLCAIETSPWSEWRAGKPLTKVQLARQLKEFKVYPASLRIGELHKKGYEREMFASVWDRYLPKSDESRYLPKNEELSRVPSCPVSCPGSKSEKSPVFMQVVPDQTDFQGGREKGVGTEPESSGAEHRRGTEKSI